MDKKYAKISDVVKADIEKVNQNLIFETDLSPKLSKELKKFMSAPSKKLRSLVTILYLRAAKIYLLPSHYELLAIIELVHNASLIHDDIIDNNDVRRSQKTLNKVFDNQIAVTAGDYILGIALNRLIKLQSFEILNLFAETIKTMCKGEINQYLNLYKKIKLDKYIEKTTQKTASLFDCALNCSYILAEEQYPKTAQNFILNFGTAFQIRDDLSNVLKKDKSKLSVDADNGIYNAPLLLSDDLNIGIEKTKTLLNNYVDEALNCLKNLDNNIYKKTLIELVELMRDV